MRRQEQTQTKSLLPAFPTLKDVGHHLGLSERTVRRYIVEGRLKAYRIGPRVIRVDRESVLRLALPMGGAA